MSKKEKDVCRCCRQEVNLGKHGPMVGAYGAFCSTCWQNFRAECMRIAREWRTGTLWR